MRVLLMMIMIRLGLHWCRGIDDIVYVTCDNLLANINNWSLICYFVCV